MSTLSAYDHHGVPIVLTIGGLDPSGGAGLPADARAVRAFGAHACGIATAVIAQNTQGVAHVEPVSATVLRVQLDNLLSDITPHAIKIGMLPTVEAVEVLAQTLGDWKPHPIVLDPVFAPSSGAAFSGEATVEAITRQLLPHCTLVTPNTLEAASLCGFKVESFSDMQRAGYEILQRFGPHKVLIKGGHTPLENEVVDVLVRNEVVREFRAERVEGTEVRGTGCMLASAIAAQMAQGVDTEEAIAQAKKWLTSQIRYAAIIGKGRRVAV